MSDQKKRLLVAAREGAILCAVFLFLCSIGSSAEDLDRKVLRKYEHWDNGKVRSCSVYDAYGNVTAKAAYRTDGTVQKIQRFDRHGNKIEEALYDERGKLDAGLDGWAAMRWRYDGSRLVSQISYGEDGRPMERKEYNELGDLAAKQYIDDGRIDQYEETDTDLLIGSEAVTYYRPDGSVEYGQEIRN